MSSAWEDFAADNVPTKDDVPVQIEDYPPDVRSTVKTIYQVWKLDPPTKKSRGYKLWIQEAREMNRIVGGEGKLRKPLKRMFAEWNKALHNGNAYNVTGPQSLTGMLRQEVAKMRHESPEAVREKYAGGEFSDAINS